MGKGVNLWCFGSISLHNSCPFFDTSLLLSLLFIFNTASLSQIFLGLEFLGMIFLPDVVSFLDELQKSGPIVVDKVPLRNIILDVLQSGNMCTCRQFCDDGIW